MLYEGAGGVCNSSGTSSENMTSIDAYYRLHGLSVNLYSWVTSGD